MYISAVIRSTTVFVPMDIVPLEESVHVIVDLCGITRRRNAFPFVNWDVLMDFVQDQISVSALMDMKATPHIGKYYINILDNDILLL